MSRESGNEKILLDFADKHLFPYKVVRKGVGEAEIVPSLCPFCHGGDHGDQNTFALSLDKGLFVCKRGSCGKRGRFEELAAHFNESACISRPASSRQPKQYTLPEIQLRPCTPQIYEYFASRKISSATVDAFGISSDENGMIVFPFTENGTLTFVKYRRPWKPSESEKKKKEWREPGTKSILFGMDMCAFSQPLIITEGQIDCMSLYEAGIHNVVSVPSGCEDLSFIENCWDWLEKFKTIILFGDSDAPGQKMVQTLAKRLDETRCRIVEEYPENPHGGICKDANEVLYFHSPFALLDMVENAREIPVKGLLDLGSVLPQDPTLVPRIKTNVPKLDEMTGGLLEGGISIVLGKAGAGKSVLTNMIVLGAIEQGYTVCVYTGEFRPGRFQHWINLQAAGSDYITLKNDPIRGKKIPVLPYNVQERIIRWYAGKLLLYDNDELFDCSQADSIFSVFLTAIRRHGAKLLVVDNLMMAVSDKEEEWRAQAIFVNRLKQLANKYGVAILLVAHARKTKAGEKLSADDLSGASASNNLADLTISVEPGHLTVLKNRDTGMLGVIDYCYCPDSKRIYQADAGDRLSLSWDKSGLPMASPRADSLEEYQVIPPMSQPF